MESLYNDLHHTGQTIETATTLRLPKRPQGDSNPNPKAFEDFGSSLAPRSSNYQLPPRSKFKPTSIVSQKQTRPIIAIKKPLSEFFESEDELDFLSSSQPDSDDFRPSEKARPVSKARKYVDPEGRIHDYDPNFLPSKSNVLAKMKFTKITKRPSRSPSPEVSILTPKRKDGPSSLPPSSPKNFPMDMISPIGEKVQQKLPLPKPRLKNKASIEASRKLSAIPIPSPRPRGRVATKGKTKVVEGKGRRKSNSTSRLPSLEVSLSTPKKKDGPSSRPPFPPTNFPMDMISPLGGKVQQKPPLPKPRTKNKPSFEISHKLSEFPMPSPQSSRKRVEGDKDDGNEKESEYDRGNVKGKGRQESGHWVRPTQYISEDEDDSITISPDTDPRTLCPYCDTPLPSSPSPLLTNILAATRKKSTRDPRPSNPLGLKAPLAIFIVACQRHKFESQLLPAAKRKGWPKTILWHKLGTRVERMKDELQALIEDPGGEREIDDVNEDVDEVERLFKDDSDRKGSKARSIFWTEVMDEVKKKGSRAVVGVRGQFANFEKTQPGYYGEQGSVIIHQTLFDMFPPASFDPARISPLTCNEFVLRILVPEVALRLIMEDRDLAGNDGIHQALIILRESSAYGVAMFPEDGGELVNGKKRGDDVMGVGDKIVMERARKRRKELEEEEAQEEKDDGRRIAGMKQGVEMVQAKEKGQTCGKKRKGKQRENQHVEEQQPAVERPRPRPRHIMKGSSSTIVLPLSDNSQPPKSSAQHMSPRNRSGTRSMYSDMDTESSDAVLIIESESDASVGSRTSTKSAVRRSRQRSVIQRSDSTMDVDLDDDDVSLVENVSDTETPVRKHSCSSSHQKDERTPKPSMLPRTRGSNNIKPLMLARMRKSQKNNSESATDLRTTRVEDTGGSEWLLNDTSQSS